MANKGAPYEREVCRTLSTWWRGTPLPEDDVLFWRTSQSGGRATARHRAGKKTTKAHCGDITAVEEDGRPLTDLMTIEIKRGYKDATASNLLDRLPGTGPYPLEAMLEQTIAAAEVRGTPHWALIHRRDRKVAVIYFPAELYNDLRAAGGFLVASRPFYRLEILVRWSDASVRSLRVTAMRLDDFLARVTPADIRRAADRVVYRRAS